MSPHLDRIADAGALLVSGAPRAEVAMPLLTLVGLCGRPGSPPGERRLRDHAIEALLWLSAHRSRDEVAGALERAWGLCATAPATAPAVPTATAPAPPAGWAERLRLRAAGGLPGAGDRLRDLLYARGALSPGSPGADDDVPLGWKLALEVEAGSARTRVPAEDFVGIERGVRWVGSPRELIGIAGGTPLRAVTPLVFGDGAVRFRWVREEVLAPFGTLRIVEGG